MMPSRGMGAVMPSKMPTRAKTIHRKDDPQDVEMYAEGGLAQQAAIAIAMKKAGKKPKNMKEGGGVNAAGNYTKPSLRKRIVSQVKAEATQGTGAGQWSARKAQLVAKRYKAEGGGYRD